MRLALWGSFVGTAAAFMAGCGPTCQDTCRRFYEQDQCNAPPVGVTREEQIQLCQDECNENLQIPGEAPAPGTERASLFDPNLLPRTNIKPVLTNEQEVGLWMDCVWSFEDVDTCRLEIERSCARVP